MKTKRIIIGISGASGIIYGVRLLECLKSAGIETHLVMSRAARLTCTVETSLFPTDLEALASHCHKINDLNSPLASGSWLCDGMIIAPCSVRTLAEIASGTCSNLLTRAADVVLKERRRLVLMLRETPLHKGHIRNMAEVTDMGAIVAPPVPAFYNNPVTIDDIIHHSVGRVLDLFDLDVGIVKRWQANLMQK